MDGMGLWGNLDPMPDPAWSPPDRGRTRHNPANDAVDEFEEMCEPPPRRSRGRKKDDGPSDFKVLCACLARLERTHPIKVARLRSDLAWLQKKSARKFGVQIFRR